MGSYFIGVIVSDYKESKDVIRYITKLDPTEIPDVYDYGMEPNQYALRFNTKGAAENVCRALEKQFRKLTGPRLYPVVMYDSRAWFNF